MSTFVNFIFTERRDSVAARQAFAYLLSIVDSVAISDTTPRDDASFRRIVLIVSTMASFMTPFMGSSTNVALPSMGVEYSMDAIALSWIATAYLLAAAVLLIPLGRLADMMGRKRVFVLGMAVLTLSSLLIVFSTGKTMLIACRVLQGIGSSMIFSTGVAILTSVFPPHERGRVLGINVASVYLGLSVGPVVGGFLTQQFGWRSIFLAVVPFGALVIVVVLWKMKTEWAEAKGERFDATGSLLFALSLSALIYGFSVLPAQAGFWLTGGSLGGLLLFVWWESRAPSPVLDVRLFRKNTVFTFSNLAALINYSATFAVGFLLSLYLQFIKGMTPQQTGMVLIAQPVVMAVLSPIAGRISDRIEPRIVSSLGMGFSAVGLVLLVLLAAETSLVTIVADLVLLGVGFALFSSPNTNAVMSSVDRRWYGVASATLGTMRMTGQMLSLGIATLIFAVVIGKVKIGPANFAQLLDSIRIAFTVFSVLCAAGVFASLARGKTRT